MRTLDIYTRGSHKSDKRITPIAGQEQACRIRIRKAGANVGKVFSDPGKSAWNPKVYRPDWEAMMARLESGETDGVVVFDLARFARRMADGERLVSAAENGLTILDAGSEYDLTSASGKENFRHKIVGTSAYSDMISESARRGKAMKASMGVVDKRRSFGFEGDGVTVVESEAQVIRDHANRLLAGETQDSLIRELNDSGVTSVHGAAWSHISYRRMITRPRNAGRIVHNGEVIEGVRLPGDPILTDDIHYHLVAMYAARKSGRQPSGKYLLTGIATCGQKDPVLCGAGLAGRPGRANRRQYHCRECGHMFVDATRLDEWAGDFAIRILSDPEHASAIEREAQEQSARRAELEAEAAGIESTLIEIAGRLGRREISLARHDAICGPLDSRLAEIARLVGVISAPLPALGSEVLTIPRADQEYGWWLDKWISSSTGEKRAMVLRALQGRRIVVSPAGPGNRFDPARVSIA